MEETFEMELQKKTSLISEKFEEHIESQFDCISTIQQDLDSQIYYFTMLIRREIATQNRIHAFMLVLKLNKLLDTKI